MLFRLNNILFEGIGTRRNYRILLNMTVHCDYRQDSFDAESFTVSRDGIFIKTNKSLPKGSNLFLTFKLPSNGHDFATMGNTLYSISKSTPQPRISPPGAGLFFVDLDSDDRDYIDRYIKGTA